MYSQDVGSADNRGRQVDRYRITGSLGAGGMGEVLRAVHVELGREVAIKRLKSELSLDESVLKRFENEARAVNLIRHENIVEVTDFYTSAEGQVHMVMELLEGRSLGDLIKAAAPLPSARVAHIGAQIADALCAAHEHGVIHRDLKPENIVLIPNETAGRRGHLVKILDFGLAQSLGGTNRDGVFGTPNYIAPEVARQEAPAAASDIYSLGILLFELITGKVPWSGDINSVLHSHVHDAPPSLTEARGSSVDPALEQLVATALAKAPSDRHNSMSACVYELKNFMQMSGMGRSRRSSLSGADDRIAARAKSACQGFDALHLPLATIASDGTIVAANASFSNFLLGIRVGLEGTKLVETSLASAWPTMAMDLESAFEGNSLGRRVEMTQGESTRHLQMWLEPTSALGQVILSLYPER